MANVTLLKTDLAQKLREQLISMARNISLKAANVEKAEILGKLDVSIECGSRQFHHRIYIADISNPCILVLDFLQKVNFIVGLEKNEIRTGEEIPLFSTSVHCTTSNFVHRIGQKENYNTSKIRMSYQEFLKFHASSDMP
ncbi:hypothetical protein AVEN_164496-1 [Araneus ventricosus]|uniref:Uncharacterized protein n=1 Tax=Araneus ventricosus TaxID=182803 RepID=A0A4Y2QIS9_ARAVE|nr:hypothetical protein AVEN_164496-1 [Araneus ventricosus]